MVGFGWAFAAGFIAVPMEMEASSARPLSWLTSAGVLLVVGSLVAYTLDYVVQRLVEALIRNRSLAHDLEEHRSRLLEQTWPMERRAHLLKIRAEVGQAVTSILDADQLLRESVELIRDRFGWHSVALYLLEKDGEQLRLAAAAGEAGAQMLAEGVQLRVGETSLAGWSAKHRRPRVASDVGDGDVHPPFPLPPRTAAQAAIPLTVESRLLGVLDVEANEKEAFDELAVEVLEGLAGQVAAAIDNARRLQEEATLLEATNPAYRATRRLAEAVSVDEVLDVVMKSVSETEAEGCILGLYDSLGSSGGQGGSLTRTWHRRGPSPFASDTKLVDYGGMAARAGVDGRRGYESAEAYATQWLASNIDDRSQLPEERRPFFDRVATLASYAGFNLGAVAHFPLVVGDRDIGFLFLYRGTPGHFCQTSLHLYETLRDQVARDVQRARRYQEAQRSLRELQALNSIANAVSGSLEMDEVLEQTLKQTLALTRYEIGLISLVDPATDRLYLAVEQGLPAPLRHRLIEGGMDGTLCDHVYRQHVVLSVPDFTEGAPTDVEGLLSMGLRSYLGIPLESREAVVGTICVFSHSPYASDPALIKLAERVGRQVGVAIENARLFAHARQRADRERLVSEVAAGMRGTLDLETVLKTAAYGIRRAMDLPAVTVRLAEGDGEGMQ
jgi:GAF domain-containing protein